MKILNATLRGTSALIVHADTLADPLSQAHERHKELTSIRKKSQADHRAIAQSEFLASLYMHAEHGPIVPGRCIDAALLAAAKLSKLGTAWRRAALVMDDAHPLVYKGPRDADSLWNDRRFVDARSVRVGTARLMRYRPRFDEWSVTIRIGVDETQLNRSEIEKVVADAGQYIGLCEMRPRHGRFEISKLKWG